jgi:hypothetical protein
VRGAPEPLLCSQASIRARVGHYQADPPNRNPTAAARLGAPRCRGSEELQSAVRQQRLGCPTVSMPPQSHGCVFSPALCIFTPKLFEKSIREGGEGCSENVTEELCNSCPRGTWMFELEQAGEGVSAPPVLIPGQARRAIIGVALIPNELRGFTAQL